MAGLDIRVAPPVHCALRYISYLLNDLFASLLAYVFIYSFTYLHTLLFIYLLTFLPTYLLTCVQLLPNLRYLIGCLRFTLKSNLQLTAELAQLSAKLGKERYNTACQTNIEFNLHFN